MGLSTIKTRTFKNIMKSLLLVIALLLAVPTNMALAKQGGDKDNRVEFYGIVESRPEKAIQGEWVIGGHIFTTDARTEVDQADGSLTVGSCAKVKVRDGRVHEIDSEPEQDCK